MTAFWRDNVGSGVTMTTFQLKEGAWLGMDVASNHTKVCMFSLVMFDGRNVTDQCEKVSATVPYPQSNTAEMINGQPVAERLKQEGAILTVGHTPRPKG